MAHILRSLVLGELQQMSNDGGEDACTVWNGVESVPRNCDFQRYMVFSAGLVGEVPFRKFSM